MASNQMIINVGVRGAKTAVRSIGKVSGAIGRAGISAFKMMTSWRAMLVGFGAVVGAVRQASKFADSLREIGTLGSAVSGDMQRLSKELRLTAGEFGQPIGKVAKAQYDIISAGMGDVATSSAVLRESAKLAVAGVTDIGTTADVITSAMNAYGQSVDDVEGTSAVLFQTVKSGKTTMTELGASLGQVIPFASSAKMPLEQVGVAMATITAKGVSTAEASTALKGAIVGLTNATPKSIKMMEKFGVEIAKTSDGGLDFTQTMENIAKVQEKNPDVINKIMPNIRGQLALKSITANMGDFRQVVNDFANKDAKLVQQAVDEMNLSFGQQSRMLKENLRSGVIELGREIGEKLLPSIQGANVALQAIGKIGWGEVATRIMDNMSAIIKALRETMVVLFGRAFAVLPQKLWEALQFAWDSLKQVSVFLWEPLIKYLRIAWIGIKKLFVDGINGIITLINDMVGLMNKLPGVNMGTIGTIATTYQEQIDGILAQSTRFEELFKAGLEGSESTSGKIKEIWAGLTSEILALNEAQKASEDDKGANAGKNLEKRLSGMDILKGKMKEVEDAEVSSFQTTIAGVRNSIKAFLAQTIAKVISAEAGKGLIGLATATAGAIAFTSLFEKMVPSFAKGGEFITDKPQLFLAGDNPGGRERVTVQPLSSSGGGGRSVTVNISAPLVDETVRDSILPAILRAVKGELA